MAFRLGQLRRYPVKSMGGEDLEFVALDERGLDGDRWFAVRDQDAGSVSLVGTAPLRWCAERWGIDADPRRLRVNCVIETTEPFVEESWIDRTVRLGAARLAIVERVPRCRTIDIDQDGVAAEGKWLKPLARERDMHIAVYADVIRGGGVEIGNPLLLR